MNGALYTILIWFSSLSIGIETTDVVKQCNIGDVHPNTSVHATISENKCNECHSDLMSLKRKHKPAIESCDKCHKPTGETHPKKNTKGFNFTKEMPSLCFDCHDIQSKKHLHQPAKDGQCLDCHSSHSSKNKKLLKEKKAGKLCEKCHQMEVPDTNIIHNPFGSGRCNKCHDPHQSDFKNFLKWDQPDLCYNCHDGVAEEMQLKRKHKPAQKKCSVCHNPHHEKQNYMLSDTVPKLCLDCHTEITGKKYTHKSSKNGKCSSCHATHASKNKKLLKEKKAVDLCKECHQLEIPETDVVHNPAGSGRCNKCHDPHQSDFKKFLKWKQPDLCYQCHDGVAEEMKLKTKHKPAQKKCTSCHDPHSDKQNMMFSDTIPNLCLDCHTDIKVKKNIHKSAKDGKCTSCHTVHASKNKKLLTQKKAVTLCNECHTLEIPENDIVHNPVKSGRCNKCHDPHQSDFDNFLKLDMPDLCFNCHDGVAEAVNGEHPHSPVKEGCFKCHDAHSNKESYLLPKSAKELCYDCHNDFNEKINKEKFVHKAVNEDLACANCHSAHGSKYEAGLKMEERELCLSCHNKAYTSEEGMVKNIKKILDKSKFSHGPVNGGCVVCHNPHASGNPYMMTSKFPIGEYAPAHKDNFALCFNCHNSELIEQKESVTATDFRNGKQNLHVLHINGNRGRNCTTCHDIHGSKNEHLIANKAPYGNWQMPIKFKKAPNGGSCFPGCHGEEKYERGM